MPAAAAFHDDDCSAAMNRKLLLNGALGLTVAAVAAFAYTSVGSTAATTTAEATAKVAKGIVLSSVTATGNITSNRDIGLSFGGAGTVTDVSVKAGDRVSAGQVLARLDAGDAQAALSLAKANLAAAQAKLSDDQNGLTPTERAQLDVSEQQAAQSLKSAQLALDNATATADMDRLTLQTAVDQAAANATTNAVQYQTAVDQAVAQQNTDNTQYSNDLTNLSTATATLATAQSNYNAASTLVTNEQADKADCPGTDPGTRTGITCAALPGRIVQDQGTQSQASSALADAKSTYNTYNSAVNSDKTKLVSDANTVTNAQNAQRSNVQKDQAALTNAQNSQKAGLLKDQQTLATAQMALDTANLSLQATKAGDLVKLQPAKAAAINGDRASVISAQNAVTTAQKNVDKMAIVAPVAGTVSRVAGNVGDTVGSNGTIAESGSSSSTSSPTGFVVLTDISALQVKVGFSEADAAKIQRGQRAVVTFDALPGTSLNGVVVTVDPTSTVVSNVVTYPVTVLLTQTTNDVKPGMTASVQVVVDKAENVLELPSSAVQTQGGQSFVNVKNGKTEERRSVVTGLKGDDTTEIVSGVKEGETVVTSSAVVRSGTTNTNQNRLPAGGGIGLGGGGGDGGAHGG